MFTVPGWTVPAHLLVNERSEKSTPTSTAIPQDSAPTRTRKRRLEDSRISSDELQKLWDQSQRSNDQSPKPNTVNLKHSQIASPSALTGVIKAANSQTKPFHHGASSSHDTKRLHQNAPQQKREHGKRLKVGVRPLQSQKSSDPPGVEQIAPQPLASKSASNDGLDVGCNSKTQNHSLTPLQAQMRNKLISSRFRHLNQTLYTTSSSNAMAMFKRSPELFADYHAGFLQQVKESWPQNPVSQFIRTLVQRGKFSKQGEKQGGDVPLPRNKRNVCVIADLGCGDAPLARGCQSQVGKRRLKFHNFDLHAPNSLVTVADIAQLPLQDRSVDVAVFCLSLMGTNWLEFVEEAWRILRADGHGEVWVAEVKSRFGRARRGVKESGIIHQTKKPSKSKMDIDAPEQGGAEKDLVNEELFDAPDPSSTAADSTDISAFVHVFERRGFQLNEESVHKDNKMFVTMTFSKAGVPKTGKFRGLKWNGRDYQGIYDGRMRFVKDEEHNLTLEEESKMLKPCLYKVR